MRGLEYYQLGEDELIVNVTDISEISEVTNVLAANWIWDSMEVQITPGEEEGEEPTEWLILNGAKPKTAQAVA